MRRPAHLLLALAIAALAVLPAARPAAAADEPGGWVTIFDGRSLEGWKPVVDNGAFRLEDGLLVAGGAEMNHLFYTGPLADGDFRNFELLAEVKTTAGSNSGIFWHTRPEKGFLLAGYEAQINNSSPKDKRRTGSLLIVEDRLESPVKDGQWFTYRIRVEGKRIVLAVNDQTIVDYTEPDNPQRPPNRQGRVLSHGAIAIQAHDPQSTVYFRNIRLRILSD